MRQFYDSYRGDEKVAPLVRRSIASPAKVSAALTQNYPAAMDIFRDAYMVEFLGLPGYALNRSLSPALIAEYQTRLPDKALLQAKLHEFYALGAAEEQGA